MTFAPQSSPPLRRLPAWASAILLIAASALAAQQDASLRAETQFRSEPGGTVLGTLNRGLSVTAGRTSGPWREVTFDAWIWTASIGPANRPGFTHMVTAVQGENLRASPDGEPLGRAVQGTQLTQLSRRGGWTHIRRTAWVPIAALPATAQPPPPAPTTPAPVADTATQGTPRPPPAPDPGEQVRIRRGASLMTGPGGAALGVTPEELAGRITSRQGNWVRVQTETWVREEDVRPSPPDSQAVTLDRLRADPERYVGQTVTWRLQFIEVRQADELRPELPQGQPYVLARGPLPEAGFIYVAITAGQAERFRRMRPLDEFSARGVILTARTRFLPTPVLRLVEEGR